MTLTTKIEAINQNFLVTVSQAQSLAEQKRTIAEFAREKLQEANEINNSAFGYIPPHETTVDGVQTRWLENVKPDGGVIVFDFDLFVEVLNWIAKTLLDRSPEVSGDYKRGHLLFADGKNISTGGLLPPADEYVFVNVVPYARRIEVGKTKSGRSFVLQVPNKIYERTATDAAARFGNSAEIKFEYMNIPDAYSVSGKMAQRTPRYQTGQLRKQTQTHWTGTNAGTNKPYTGSGWVTFRAGEPKTRIRRGGKGPLQYPAIIVNPR